MVNEKFPQNDCLRTFWPISQQLKCSQIWDLSKKMPNSANSVKIQDQSLQQIQEKHVFDPFVVHFTNFRSIRHSSGNSGSVTINLKWENCEKKQ